MAIVKLATLASDAVGAGAVRLTCAVTARLLFPAPNTSESDYLAAIAPVTYRFRVGLHVVVISVNMLRW
jgi:hypothetical protein